MSNKLSIELSGVGRAFILALILSTIIAIVVYYTGLKETLLSPLSNIVLIISIFYGACYVSKSYGTKGLVRGLIMGLLFFILILIFTLIFNFNLINFNVMITSLSICLVSGALGGILGIGLSDQ